MLKGERCLGPKCRQEKQSGVRTRGRVMRRKISERGLQLQEKQKVRHTYGVLERQFRRFFAEAERLPGVTGENLLALLERRLDNVIYRLSFAASRAQARQLVRHGSFSLNGRKTDIPSCLVKPGDVITWRERSQKSEYYKQLAKQTESITVPDWLELDTQNLVARVLSSPTISDVETRFNETLIVEYYSR